MLDSIPSKRSSVLVVIFGGLLWAWLASPAWGGDCAESIGQASEAYAEGRFEDAILFLDNCLEQPGLDSETRSRAYRLLGMAYIAMDYRERAKLSIRNLLDLVPDYKPDPELEGPTFVKIVDDINKRQIPVPPIPIDDEVTQVTSPIKTTGFFISALLGMRTVGGDDFDGETYYYFGSSDEYFFVPKMDNAFAMGLVATYQTKFIAGEFVFSQSSHNFIWGFDGLTLFEDTATNRFIGFNVKVFPISEGTLRPFLLVGGFKNAISVGSGFATIDTSSWHLFNVRDGELKGTGYNLGAGLCVHPSPLLVVTGGVTYHSVTFDMIDDIDLEETSSSTGMDFYLTVGVNLLR